MSAYQPAGDAQKTLDAANRVLQVDPNNVRALALLAYNYRVAATAGWSADAAKSVQWLRNMASRACRPLPDHA